MASKIIHISVIFLMLLALYYPARAQEDTCHLGTYKQTNGPIQDFTCIECPDGTFMPQTDHTNTNCFDCTKIENSTLEVLISPCTRSRDADIQCVDGYYRILARNPQAKPVCKECDPCHELLHEIRRCQNYSNTWCCPDVNYDYEYDKQGTALCRERPWMCRKGQYMDTSLNDCKPCPDGTFMSVDYHSYTKCWDCQYHSDADLPLHTELIQTCNSTHPAIYSCKEGYYINHSLSYRGDDIGCLPCKSCSDEMFVGRQCDKFHDTVCCHRPEMIVVDGRTGAKCLECKDEDNNESTLDNNCKKSGEKGHTEIETTEIKPNATDSKDFAKYRNVSGCQPYYVGLTAESLIIVAFMLYVIWKNRVCIRLGIVPFARALRKCAPGWTKTSASNRRSKNNEHFEESTELHDGLSHMMRHLNAKDNKRSENNFPRRVCMALVGKTGSGKSATGNTILGEKKFKCGDSTSPVTKDTMLGHSEFNGTDFTVADIPGIGEECDDINKVKDSLVSFFQENSKGISVVLFIVRYGLRFTKDDSHMLEMLRSTFGNDFIKGQVIMIMTFGDIFKQNNGKQTFKQWCAKQDGSFANLFDECKKHAMLLDNTVNKKKRKRCIEDLLGLIKNMSGYGPSSFRRQRDDADNEDPDEEDKMITIEENTNV